MNKQIRHKSWITLLIFMLITVLYHSSYQAYAGSIAPISPYRIVAYYPSWRFTEYPPSRIPADKVTVINYAFIMPSTTGECVLENPQDSRNHFSALQLLKKTNPNLKIMASVGGAGLDKEFIAATANPTLLNRFVNSCVELVKTYKLDGMDVDWEYPEAAQKTTFTTLITNLRLALNSLEITTHQHFLLTIAAPSSLGNMQGLDLAQITPNLDWINLMTYDFYGSWSNTTGHNAALQHNPADPNIWSGDYVVHLYLTLNVPPEKLTLGVPFYGRAWQGVKDINHGLFQPFRHGTPDSEEDSYPYDLIKQNYLNKFTRYWDDAASVPWLYNASKSLMISYDDAQSLNLKADLIRTHHLGGVMIWEITGDDAAHSLLTALYNTMK